MPANKRSDLTPRFKLIFIAVLSLTLLSLTLQAALVVLRIDTQQAATLAEACSTTFKLGFGAIVGLVACKSA
ncbi:hypothetical protein ABZ671_30305 [Micromonospora sp. NPDC006766]|uniref:hypothetical protein n=1 Tax=Micromonospora sp. NPDC006766 TaxID=3154778 RepID=UPI0033FFC784